MQTMAPGEMEIQVQVSTIKALNYYKLLIIISRINKTPGTAEGVLTTR